MIKNMRQALVISFIALFFSGPAVAAEFVFGAQSAEWAREGEYAIEVTINTGADEINAVGGTIDYPTDLLALRDIQYSDSIVSLWIDDPKFVYPGKVAFSGIIPGGYRGEGGKIFKLVFTAQKEGRAVVTLNNAQALLNDGNGTSASAASAPFAVTVSPLVGVQAPRVAEVPDADLPESFKPEIARDATIADGKWFVVFTTQDKASGVDHYEIKESSPQGLGLAGDWVRAESPYVLRDQTLRSAVIVKAIDRAGNERVAYVEPLRALRWYQNYGAWVIIVVSLVIVLALVKIIWRVFSKK